MQGLNGGDAPLHYATQNNCYKVVRQLVDKGAMVNKPFQCKSKFHKKYPYAIELKPTKRTNVLKSITIVWLL